MIEVLFELSGDCFVDVMWFCYVLVVCFDLLEWFGWIVLFDDVFVVVIVIVVDFGIVLDCDVFLIVVWVELIDVFMVFLLYGMWGDWLLLGWLFV